MWRVFDGVASVGQRVGQEIAARTVGEILGQPLRGDGVLQMRP